MTIKDDKHEESKAKLVESVSVPVSRMNQRDEDKPEVKEN